MVLKIKSGVYSMNYQYSRDMIAILMNDLAMLIEASEAYNQEYYDSEYARITREIQDFELYL